MAIGHAPEIILVLILVLLIFGARRLPEIGDGIGRGLREFRSAVSDQPAQADGEVAGSGLPVRPQQPPR